MMREIPCQARRARRPSPLYPWAILCLGALAWSCADDLSSVPRVSAAELREAISRGEAAALDVRTLYAFYLGHIKDALHISLSELEHRLAELPRDRRIIAYCS